MFELAHLGKFGDLPVVPCQLNVWIVVSRYCKAPLDLHHIINRSLFYFIFVVYAHFAINFLGGYDEGETWRCRYFSRLENSLRAVKWLLKHVIHAILRPEFHVGFAEGESSASGHLVKKFEVAGEEVAVEFKVDVTSLLLELVEVKVGVVRHHRFDGLGAAAFDVGVVDALGNSLNFRVLRHLDLIFECILELLIILPRLLQLLVLLTLVKLLAELSLVKLAPGFLLHLLEHAQLLLDDLGVRDDQGVPLPLWNTLLHFFYFFGSQCLHPLLLLSLGFRELFPHILFSLHFLLG